MAPENSHSLPTPLVNDKGRYHSHLLVRCEDAPSLRSADKLDPISFGLCDKGRSIERKTSSVRAADHTDKRSGGDSRKPVVNDSVLYRSLPHSTSIPDPALRPSLVRRDFATAVASPCHFCGPPGLPAATRFSESRNPGDRDLAAACDSFLQQISLTGGVIQIAAVQNDACPNGKPPSGSSGGR